MERKEDNSFPGKGKEKKKEMEKDRQGKVEKGASKRIIVAVEVVAGRFRSGFSLTNLWKRTHHRPNFSNGLERILARLQA